MRGASQKALGHGDTRVLHELGKALSRAAAVRLRDGDLLPADRQFQM